MYYPIIVLFVHFYLATFVHSYFSINTRSILVEIILVISKSFPSVALNIKIVIKKRLVPLNRF